ncbi:MAG: alcohol dehydrogenase catalytic domain-containing protein [Acidocella sp.]|uniref:alcohol dehydrogenase catalytic domain-containing protein n=1 Tax=Acidocella sp. TaxID=50710 RepID=UPI003FD73464
MKAAGFYAARYIRTEDVAEPEIDEHEVLVKVCHAGICGTDLHEYAADPIFGPARPHSYTGAKAPQILCHEFSGDVVRIGSKVEHVSPGILVSIQPMIAPPDDYHTSRSLPRLSEQVAAIGLSWKSGGMAQYAVNAVPLPRAYRPSMGR